MGCFLLFVLTNMTLVAALVYLFSVHASNGCRFFVCSTGSLFSALFGVHFTLLSVFVGFSVIRVLFLVFLWWILVISLIVLGDVVSWEVDGCRFTLGDATPPSEDGCMFLLCYGKLRPVSSVHNCVLVLGLLGSGGLDSAVQQ